jgi:hypothetical protein
MAEFYSQNPSFEQAPNSPQNPRIIISVSDPIKQGDGISAYISYRIETQVTKFMLVCHN